MTILSATHRPMVVALVAGFIALVGSAFSPYTTSAQNSGNDSEAVIDQVSTSERTADVVGATSLSPDQLFRTVLGRRSSVAPFVAPSRGEGPLHPDGQRAIVRQDGRGNSATIDQQDASNVAAIIQLGHRNDTRIRQRGRSNAAGVVLNGNNNGVDVLQSGVGNRYLLGFTGDNLGRPGTRSITQKGTNNVLVELGSNSMPFNIRQKGNGMRMVIRHSGRK